MGQLIQLRGFARYSSYVLQARKLFLIGKTCTVYGLHIVVLLTMSVLTVSRGQTTEVSLEQLANQSSTGLRPFVDTIQHGGRPVFAGIEVFPSFYLGRWKGGGTRLLIARYAGATTVYHLRLQYYMGVDSVENQPGTFDLPAPPHWRVAPGVTFWLAEAPYRAFFVRIEGGLVLPQGKVFGELAIGGTLPVWRPVYLTASVSLRTRSVEETPVIAFRRVSLILALYLPVHQAGY